jgi:polar amino acid transport system permease protein
MLESLAQWPELLTVLLPGLWVSVRLTVVLVVIGTAMAISLALMLRSRQRLVRYIGITITEIGRGMPALVLVYLVYFGLPDIGVNPPAFLAAAVALGINFGAYTTDVFSSGFDAVPVGQVEAANALGLGPVVTFFRVVLPQAIRIVTPAFLGWVIVYFQTTSLAFAIAVPELMSAAYTQASATFEYLNTLLLAGLLYAVIAIPGSQLVAALERSQETRAG